jgi:hypothetical protein
MIAQALIPASPGTISPHSAAASSLAAMRATASASVLLINNLIGVGFGSLFIGALSNRLTPSFGGEALRFAILISLGFYLLAALRMTLAGRHLAKEWMG